MGVGSVFQWKTGDASLWTNPPTGSVLIGADTVGGGVMKFPGTPAGTDGALVYFGTTVEQIQDAIGTALTDSSTIDFTYDDVGNTITAIIKAASVTKAMLENMPALTLAGNNTGGSATRQDLTVAQVQTMLGLGTAAYTASTAYDAAGAAAAAQAASQPVDATLTALAGQNWATDKIPVGTGVDTVTQLTLGANTFPAKSSAGAVAAKAITDFGLSLVDDADQATARSTLGLGTAATQNTGAFDAAGAAAAAQAASQPVDATLTSLAGQNWALDSVPVGSGADTVAQVAVGANKILAKASTGTYSAKSITDYVISTMWGVADAIGLTALINAATILVNGLMSFTDKRRMGQQFDAYADFGITGGGITLNATGSITSGSNQLTDSANSFLASMDGWRVTIPRAGAGSGVNAAMLVGYAKYISAGRMDVYTTSALSVALNASNTNTAAQANVHSDDNVGWAALVAAVNASTYGFARVTLGQNAQNAFGFYNNLSFNKMVQFVGMGGTHNADTGDYTKTGGTRLFWTGASSDGGVAFGAAISFAPTGVQSLKRVAWKSIFLDARNGDQNQALIPLKFSSCQGWELDDFMIMDGLGINLMVDIGTTPSEAKDNTRWHIGSGCIRALDQVAVNAIRPNTDGSGNAVTNVTTATGTGAGVANLTSGTPITLGVTWSGVAPRTGPDYLWIMTASGKRTLSRYTSFTGSAPGAIVFQGVTCMVEDDVHTVSTIVGGAIIQADPLRSCSIYFNGGSGANSCCGKVDGPLQIRDSSVQPVGGQALWGPAAVEHGNSDSIIVDVLLINGGNIGTAATASAAINRINKAGITFNCATSSATLVARNNVYRDSDPGSGGFHSIALTGAGAAVAFPAGPNISRGKQLANGAPLSTIEAGAIFYDMDPNCTLPLGSYGIPTTASATIGTATPGTQIGASIPIAALGWQQGLQFEVDFVLSKTAAGTTAPGFTVGMRLGTTGGSGDALVASVATLGTPTAIADAAHATALFYTTVAGAVTSVSSVLRVLKIVQAATGFGAIDLSNAAGAAASFSNNQNGLKASFWVFAGTGSTVTLQKGATIKVTRSSS